MCSIIKASLYCLNTAIDEIKFTKIQGCGVWAFFELQKSEKFKYQEL